MADRDSLPPPYFDPIPPRPPPSPISALDASGVQQLLDFEQEHGNRLPVVQVLERRIEALREGAQPSGAVEQDMPEVTQSSSGSSVSPDTSNAPKINPPSQGVPTNPAQPR